MPEHLEPGAGLRVRTERAAARKHAGKRQGVSDRYERGEEVSAGKIENGAHSRTTAGVSSLPRGSAAVVEAIASLK